MRHGFLRDGLLIVAAVAAGSLAAPGVGRAAADDAQVTVVAVGGEQQTLSLAALGAGDVDGRSYMLRSSAGESAQTVTGFSLAAILDAASADPYGFSYLEVQRPGGGSVLLSRHQALDPGAFAEGPPVIYATASGTVFLRPSSGPDDLNATDSFEAPQGITMILRSGSPLQVRAHASTLRTRPGKPVTFSAIVDRAGAGEQLAYSWYFDDGASSTGARTRHRFSRRGSYDVVVGVTTPGDDAGASAVVTVQVGPPLAGPDRTGGGTNTDADAPDHGTASGASAGAPPGAAGAPIENSATTAPQTSRSQHCSRSDRQCERHGKGRRRPAESRPAGAPVSGLLLTNAAEAPAHPRPAPAARTGNLDGEGGGSGLPSAALGLLVTAGLLGLGVLAELRRPFMALSTTKASRGPLQ